MRIKNFEATWVASVDFAASDRQAALRAMHRVKVGPAAVASGWGTDVAGSDRRSVHAWFNLLKEKFCRRHRKLRIISSA